MNAEFFLLASFLTPLIGALLIWFFGEESRTRELLLAITSLTTLGMVIGLLARVYAGEEVAIVLLDGFLPIAGGSIAFELEPLGIVYATVAAGLFPITSMYAVGYMNGHHETNQRRFFTCFSLAIFAALGIAYAGNLATLFLFYEVLTLSTYPLVTHHQKPESRRAGRVYLGILLSTSVGLFLLGVAWTGHAAQSLEFAQGGILGDAISERELPILVGLFAYGCGKAALMPLHRWLPNAMVAPTPVSALLHAVAVVKAGVFSIVKIFVYVIGIERLAETGASEWLMAVCGFTILASSLIAFSQDNLKARLAYSTISQLAYIVLGAALATPEGVVGSALHIATHAVGKITLFFCAGAIMVGAHKKNISELDGLGKTMPITIAAFFVGALSIIGLPPTGGAWSKWQLALGAADDHAIYVGVLMLSSLLNIGYLIPIPVRAFFFPAKDPHEHSDHHSHDEHHDAASNWRIGEQIREAPMKCVIPLVITAIACIVLFFWSNPIAHLVSPIVGLQR